MILIRNANIYSPAPLGKRDILFSEKVLKIAEHIPESAEPLCERVIDAQGKALVPGFIDPHVHVAGAGGEGGFYSRTPEVQLSTLLKSGITTVVGLAGTDGTARTPEVLYAKVCALNEEGITCYMLTGSYELPSPTVTGSVRRDIVFIDKVLGVKLALSDRRSSHPGIQELKELASAAYTGGMLSGKRGYVHIHMGDEKAGLTPLRKIMEETQLPPYVFYPTHINRGRALFEEAMAFAKAGGTIDFTAGMNAKYGWPKAVKTSRGIAECLRNGVPAERITVSTDGNGSMALYDEAGKLQGLVVTPVCSLPEEFRDLIFEEGFSLEQALPFFTSNTAAAIGKFPQKGCVREGSDADFLLLDENYTLRNTFARGAELYDAAANRCKKGTFEE